MSRDVLTQSSSPPSKRGEPRLRTGFFSRRAAVVVLVVWILLVGLGSSFGSHLSSVERNNQASFLPKDAPSSIVAADERHFPGGSSLPAVVVAASHHRLTSKELAALAALRARLDHALPSGVGRPGPIVVAKDHQAAFFTVPYAESLGSSAISRDLDALQHQLASAEPAVQTGITGPAAFLAGEIHVFSHIDRTLLLVTILVVAVILILVYRSPFLWLLPLLSAGLGISLTMGILYGLGKAGLVVNGMNFGILTVLLFGAGTDYALLLIARYREELHHRADHREALQEALRRVAPPILTSGGTVVLALLCLTLAEESDVSALGPVCAIGIVVALGAMLTLLPALLSLLGPKVFWPRVPLEAGATEPSSNSLQRQSAWARVASAVTTRPLRIGIGGVVLLLVLIGGISDLHAGDVHNQGLLGHVEAVSAERLLSAHFPAGSGAPAVVLVRNPAELSVARRVTETTPGIVSVGATEQSGHLALFDATLADPPTTAAARATIVRLRDDLARATPPGSVLVGGSTATQVDLDRAARHDDVLIAPIIAAVVFVMLALLLRSLVAPLLLVIGVVASFFASLGVTSVVFVSLLGLHGTDQSLPLFGYVFLVALGVDYSVFLMARAREAAVAGEDTPHALRRAVTTTGGVITSAGVVLAATFAVLGILPLLVLAELGFLVAFGVLLDTFVVRSLVIPAWCTELGGRIWWPSRLATDDARSKPALQSS